MTDRFKYPGDLFGCVACYAIERLVAAYAGAFGVVAKIGGATQTIGYSGDILDNAALATFLTGEPYGKVMTVANQVSGVGGLVATGGIEPPHIIPAYKIGASTAMLFEGATTEGQQFGMEMVAPVSSWGIVDGNYTVMAVLRPTQSNFSPQNTLDGQEGGTVLSLEASPILHATGKAILPWDGNITNVTPAAGLVPGMLLTSPTFHPLLECHVDHFSMTGPNTATVVAFGGGPIALPDPDNPDVPHQLTFTLPIARCYQSGGGNPGGWALSSRGYFGGEIKFEPQDFCGVEIQPVVVAWSNRDANHPSPADVPGFKAWNNELVESSPLVSSRTEIASHGFIGRGGGSIGNGYTRNGDFWLAALLIWNKALTQAERAIVAEALRVRFAINSRRSTRQVPYVTTTGDSITQEYVTKGNYGWAKRLADKFPDNVRFTNYAAAGMPVTPLYQGYPALASNEGAFPIRIAGHLNYSKSKNVFVIWGGGNDLAGGFKFFCDFDVATNEVRASQLAQTGLASAPGSVLLTLPAIPAQLVVGALVENATTPASIPAGAVVVAINAATSQVQISAAVTSPGVGQFDFIQFRFHNSVVDRRVEFSTLPGLLTGITAGPIYYVKAITAIDRYTIAATRGGAVIDLGGSAPDTGTMFQYPRTPTEIFAGLERLVAAAAAAAPGVKIYMFTNTPRIGKQYNPEITEINNLIKTGGAGGYEIVDVAANPIFATHDVPPEHLSPGHRDGTHLNEAGSQAVADQFYPILNAYLFP